MPDNNDQFDLESHVQKLARLLKETGLGEIEYVEGDRRIRCSLNAPAAAVATSNGAPAASNQANVTPALPAGTPVTAPMVGTVYLAPEPGKPAFVKKGDTVKEGDTLLIIEAMKVMNPIKAPTSGTIAEVLAADTKPVEFGETLLVIA